ncbi:hypothetical protein NUU61_000301 [Penicillium alfredii]|uniref:Uncharacterized protein n=1 Tax=Penicillium alfredii TaxID=1506179 RepID=A0A9W9KQS4_9EURO|nr:uncharacterized protein NUU61_000301 [Penicillium alfredii]KAJ5114542.1 hypothetical protein NUU61_000301 [Penicillium alfredii]
MSSDASSPCSPSSGCAPFNTPVSFGVQPRANPQSFHPSFLPVIRHLETPLSQLFSSTTGLPHPDFPVTILAYHLLTSTQLDSLACHFHQVWPFVPATLWYPMQIAPWIGTPEEQDVDLQTKRRRFGRFIGLGGCETPVIDNGSFSHTDQTDTETASVLEWMEQQWEDALARARNERRFDGKNP